MSNIIDKISRIDGIEDYILLTKESVDRLVENSKRLDDKSIKIIVELSKWIYNNNMIEEDNE